MMLFNALSIRHFSIQQQKISCFSSNLFIWPKQLVVLWWKGLVLLPQRFFWAVFGALCPVSGGVGCPGFPWLSLPGQGVNASYGMITRQPVPQFPRCEMGLTALPSRGSDRIPQLRHLHHSRTGHLSISPKKQSPNQIPARPLGTERGREG